jgi:hypothetical protein
MHFLQMHNVNDTTLRPDITFLSHHLFAEFNQMSDKVVDAGLGQAFFVYFEFD